MKKWLVLLLPVILISACREEPVIERAEEPIETNYPFTENDVVKGRMRVKLKNEPTGEVTVRSAGGQVTTGIRALDDYASALGITRMERTFPPAGKYEERSRREGLHLWYDVWFSEDIAATRATAGLAVIDDIEIASPVLKVISNAAPAAPAFMKYINNQQTRNDFYPFNDPDLPKLWSYYNPGSQTWQESGADIRLFEAWRHYKGHPDIIVAIVDGGIELRNPDLQDNIWINKNEIAGNGIDDDGNGYTDDVYGYNFVSMNAVIKGQRHGTHVAGTIGATNNNGEGISGIAGGDGSPNSGVKIMSCQIFEHPPGNYNRDIVSQNIAAAIKYGADNGAVISQNSWGYAVDTRTSYVDPAHKEAIDYFVKYAGCDNNGDQLPGSPMKGGIVLFAAGNSNSSDPRVGAPADYEKVLGVAAIGPDYKKPVYSNYGEYIDITAPGGLGDNEKGIYSTTISTLGYYEYRYGTSMACPHVAGVAALVIQKYGVGKPGFTAGRLEEILMATTYDLDRYNPGYIGKLGNGCVDAAAAVGAEIPDIPPFSLRSNPITDGILAIRVNTELAGKARITIYNNTGASIYSKEIETRRYTFTNIDISILSAGYYTFEYSCNGTTIQDKFIKY